MNETRVVPVEHPMQPVVMVDGVDRFKSNAIVRFLLDNGPFDMNRIAMMFFSDDDRRQFAQLIGYSVCGYHDLGYAEPISSAPPTDDARGDDARGAARWRKLCELLDDCDIGRVIATNIRAYESRELTPLIDSAISHAQAKGVEGV